MKLHLYYDSLIYGVKEKHRSLACWTAVFQYYILIFCYYCTIW